MTQTRDRSTTTVGAPIRLHAVTKSYRLGDGSVIEAAKDVDLAIEPGTFTAVVGQSGSGKSTLLHLIGAIDVPDAGTITVGDLDVTRLDRNAAADYRASIGFVFQQFHLLPVLTVRDNILAPLVARKVSFDRHERAGELIDAVGLDGRGDSLPSQLSGGQQQRVAIARALISQPGLLLADEPTGNLDSHTAAEIITLLIDLQRRHHATLIMATHDNDLASQADRTVRIHDGRLV
jgi:putative ABC transport system ATP-binding protein